MLDYELNTPNVVGGPTNDLLLVNGDLTLNGTLNMSTANPLGLFPGTYRLIGYSGALTNPGWNAGIRPVPGRLHAERRPVHPDLRGRQVNLINAKRPVPLVFWDSDDTAVAQQQHRQWGGSWQPGLAPLRQRAWTDSCRRPQRAMAADGFAVFMARPWHGHR